MKKAKAKKKKSVNKKITARIIVKSIARSKTKPKAKPKARPKARPKAKAKVRYLTINPEKDVAFDEVEELRRIETCLDIIFGHLRRIKNEGGEGSLQLILDYFYSKYVTRFLSRQ